MGDKSHLGLPVLSHKLYRPCIPVHDFFSGGFDWIKEKYQDVREQRKRRQWAAEREKTGHSVGQLSHQTHGATPGPSADFEPNFENAFSRNSTQKATKTKFDRNALVLGGGEQAFKVHAAGPALVGHNSVPK